MLGRRYDNRGMHAVENVVWESAVFATKDHRDRAVGGRLEQLSCRGARIDEAPLRAASSCGEADHTHAVRDGLVEGVESLDSLDEVLRAMRDSLETIWIVLHGTHKAETRDTHVLHRAN